MTDASIVMEIRQSAEVYRRVYVFPFGYSWAYPAAAWAALAEGMPWEALGLGALAFVLGWTQLPSDVGTLVGLCVTVPLTATQMVRTRTFVTTNRLVKVRGLAGGWAETPLAGVLDGRVEYPAPGVRSFGDVVLVTLQGERRIRAVDRPDVVLARVLALRPSEPAREQCGSRGRTSESSAGVLPAASPRHPEGTSKRH